MYVRGQGVDWMAGYKWGGRVNEGWIVKVEINIMDTSKEP